MLATLPPLYLLIEAACSAALSCAACVLLLPLLRRHAAVRPNSRSSHTIPTPQGGGAAVIGTLIIVVALTLSFRLVPPELPLAVPLSMLAAALLIACVGAVDDLRTLEIAPRLLFQAFCVALILYFLPADLRLLPSLPWWLERALAFVAGVWVINLVNFMDGLDWMTVVETVPIAAGIILLGYWGDIPVELMIVAAALLGAMLGFAPLNRPVARLFLGDVGSLPVGLILAWLLILVAGKGYRTAVVILPAYYFADATLTLLLRICRGEPFWRAHRSHFYQRARDGGFSVTEVVTSVFALNVCLAALALATELIPGRATNLTVLALAAILVGALLWMFARGKLPASVPAG